MLTPQELLDQTVKATLHAYDLALERTMCYKAYVDADLELLPASLPDLPEGTILKLEQYGFEISLPLGTDISPWLDAFLQPGWKTEHGYCTTFTRGFYQEAADKTGHTTSTFRYLVIHLKMKAK